MLPRSLNDASNLKRHRAKQLSRVDPLNHAVMNKCRLVRRHARECTMNDRSWWAFTNLRTRLRSIEGHRVCGTSCEHLHPGRRDGKSVLVLSAATALVEWP